MKQVLLFAVSLTICLMLYAEVPPAEPGGLKDSTIPQVTPHFTPPVIVDRNEPKEPMKSGEPVLVPIPPPGFADSQTKETDPAPVQVDYHPVIVDRNEPKEVNPVVTPVEYDPKTIDRNEPKELIKTDGSGPMRWDPDSYEPDDTYNTAQYISVTSTLQSQNHTMDDVGGTDVDWYYFYGIPGRTYIFYSTGTLDNFIYLYQDNGTTEIDWDDDDGDGLNFYLEYTPTAQAYYRLKVGSYYTYTGPYVFYFRTGAPVDSWEIDDTPATAGPIFPSPTLTTYNHTIHNATDVDWYSFTGYTGRIYTFYSTGYTDVRVYLYASNGTTQLDFDDDDGEGNNFYLQYTFSTNGTYYLKVEPYPGNAGAYAINFLYGANPDSYEPDSGINEWTSIEAFQPYAQSQTHTLHNPTDADWYHFICIQDITYHFWSTGNEDTRAYIYESVLGTPLASDDDSGEGNNFDLSFSASPTWGYYVKVDGYNGAVGTYNFNWRHDLYSDSYEMDNSSNAARLITVTPSETIEQHSFHTWVDEDWYRFYGVPGQLYTFFSTNGQYNSYDVDSQIYLYQDDGTTLIDWDDDDGDLNNFFLQFAPASPAYYKLKCKGYNGCVEGYAFHYYFTTVADAYEADNTASAYTTLTPTTAEQTQNHTLHTTTDQDWYRFYATSGRLYTFWSTWTIDNQVYLYQDNGTTLISWDDDGGEGLNFNLAFNCATDGYYKLKVIGYNGSMSAYQLHYIYGAVPDAFEDDNSATDFTQLYPSAYTVSQAHTLHNSTDQDWFQFTGVAGKRYAFWSEGNTDTQIYLYLANGTTQLAWDDDNGTGTNFNLQYVFSSTADYKLKVIGYAGAAGSYTFYFAYGAQPDAYEDDDNASTCTALNVTAILQTQNHTLQDADDQDWFRFQGVEHRTYVFSSTGNTDTQAYLYWDDGTTLITSDDDSGPENNFQLSFLCQTTGYYKLMVLPYTADAGPYVFNYIYELLPSPTNLQLVKSDANVHLTWNTVSGATLYRVYQSDNPYTGFSLLVNTSVASVLIPANQAKKFFRVIAFN